MHLRLYPLDKRLLRLLSDLSDVQGQVKLSQTELSSMLGVTHPTVNEHLQQLKRQGKIELARKKITLLDGLGGRLHHIV